MFLGVVFLVIGAVIVLNAVFGVQIPAMRILIGLFLLYMGAKFLIGNHWRSDWDCGSVGCDPAKGRVFFSSGRTEPTKLSDLEDREFSTVFAHGELDLSKTELDPDAQLSLNTVFGSTHVWVANDTNLVTKVNSVAGSVQLPSESAPGGGKTLRLDINNVFGSTRIERK